MYFFTFINNDMYEMSCFHLIVTIEYSLISHKFQIQSSKKCWWNFTLINDNYDSEMIPGKRSCVKIQLVTLSVVIISLMLKLFELVF